MEADGMVATLKDWSQDTFSFLPSLLVIALILVATRIIARRTPFPECFDLSRGNLLADLRSGYYWCWIGSAGVRLR